MQWSGSPPRAWGRPSPRTSRASPTVHPHGRGEDIGEGAAAAKVDGSPPRAWGGLVTVQFHAASSRFTPTGVGRTKPTGSPSASSPVHPHGRGEDIPPYSVELRSRRFTPTGVGRTASRLARQLGRRFTPTGVGRTYSSSGRDREGTVHPHGRGEDVLSAARSSSAVGSPPRAWGGQPRDLGRRRLLRFTPTGVGRTASCMTTTTGTPVHPHGRGEDFTALAAPAGSSVHPHGRGEDSVKDFFESSSSGSPPRAWGGRAGSAAATDGHRFTPTGVGRTAPAHRSADHTPVHPHGRGEDMLLWWIGRVHLPVHPHGRGEDLAPAPVLRVGYGSPPRAWGGPRCSPTSRKRPTVHPHGRGEDEVTDSSSRPSYGSPPRAWGGLVGRAPARGLGRFTPTGVGRTASPQKSVRGVSVHPHGRGEDFEQRPRVLRAVGSPPRAWGGPGSDVGPRVGGRFTPTGVGRTHGHEPVHTSRSVHPHGRGEDFEATHSIAFPTGSPPRAWGGRAALVLALAGLRFTPTGVGRTTLHLRPRAARAQGSPPRAWGGLRTREACEDALRFTPTGVGRTPELSRAGPQDPVHPHGRGEDSSSSGTRVTGCGSPPRAWGGRRGGSPWPSPGSVHPHGRGEDLTNRERGRVARGSPPRAWGGPWPCPRRNPL